MAKMPLLLAILLPTLYLAQESLAKPNLPHRPQKPSLAIHQPARPRQIICQPDRPTLPKLPFGKPNSHKPSNLANPCQAARQLTKLLSAQTTLSPELVFSQTLIQTFGAKELGQVFQAQTIQQAQISHLEKSANQKWLSAQLESNQGNFLVVFHWEKGGWKLFGTKAL